MHVFDICVRKYKNHISTMFTIKPKQTEKLNITSSTSVHLIVVLDLDCCSDRLFLYEYPKLIINANYSKNGVNNFLSCILSTFFPLFFFSKAHTKLHNRNKDKSVIKSIVV